MGFGIGSYATIWSTERVSESMTKCRISTSRKNKNTGNYETDFSGFVAFVGTACANKASRLIERDHIKITQCDVKSKYDEEKKVTYYNFYVFDFEDQKGSKKSSSNKENKPVEANEVESNPVEDDDGDEPW